MKDETMITEVFKQRTEELFDRSDAEHAEDRAERRAARRRILEKVENVVAQNERLKK